MHWPKKTTLFDDRQRTRREPLRRGENLFDFYDQCGRNGYNEIRSIINGWLSDIPIEHCAELISRMRYGRNREFSAALCELVTHALLVNLKFKVVLHPEVPNSTKRPDFAVTDENGKVLCYVEVTMVNPTSAVDAEVNRESAIYNAIDGANLPDGCLLGYDLVRAGTQSPALGPLVASIEQWARENVEPAKSSVITKQFVAGEWIVELELYSGGSAPSGPAIGVAGMRGGKISPNKDIRDALTKKSRRYGAMDAPYIIVVADAKEQLFGEEQIRNAITEAVFLDERMVVTDGESKREYSGNGFWHGNDGPKNQHVSAVLMIPKIGIWDLRENKWQPILAINPWAQNVVPEEFKALSRLEADDGKWVPREGKNFADVLNLPTPWPPGE